MKKREALKLALKAMKSFQNGTSGLYEGEFEEEIKACEEALAQPQPQRKPITDEQAMANFLNTDVETYRKFKTWEAAHGIKE